VTRNTVQELLLTVNTHSISPVKFSLLAYHSSLRTFYGTFYHFSIFLEEAWAVTNYVPNGSLKNLSKLQHSITMYKI